ncbi:hypothetical protein CROQUDRAFT_650518 [Cronartium quercuum f. sp. fusiforme G11]|uniref:Probable 26S proteasome regulatory subunit p27 n=1 Tax=Cronartium quercuum f. sp. fusiforme G11 TaxID=708437 RepID=A0A9P6THC6_9BASI|nr:hypothetical protein CROQUDRAFT_650518 [Cronartium quercuum f. sp. fusiforme G11]
MGRSIHGIERGPSMPGSIKDSMNPMEKFNWLSERKNEIQTEISAQFEVLQANGIDLDSPLIDNSGFPRDDVSDLASVRVARARVHELKNDLREVVDQLAHTLPLILPRSDANILGATSKEPDSTSSSMEPFARVDAVSEGSPAQLAGLKVGDQIVKFGSVDASNHDGLQALATLTRQSEGQELDVVWFRYDERDKRRMISKQLIPLSGWGGRGSLGCHIVPI